DGDPSWYRAGGVVLSGQGLAGQGNGPSVRFPLGNVEPPPAGAVDRPGTHRMKARLVADTDRGSADPDVRSVWPGVIETGGVAVGGARAAGPQPGAAGLFRAGSPGAEGSAPSRRFQATIRAATRTASIRLTVLARPVHAMS